MKPENAEKHTIFKCLRGSRSYGTFTETSDYDYGGVLIAPVEYKFGFLNTCNQYEDKQNETTIYEIRKFFKLASDNNPNVMELLWIRESEWLYHHPAWLKVLEHRDSFLSTRVKHTYGGYAAAQFKKIKSHRNWLINPPKEPPKRSDFDLPEGESLLTKDHQNTFYQLVNLFIRDRWEYHDIEEPLKERIGEVDFIGIMHHKGLTPEMWDQVKQMTGASDAFMYALQQEKSYRNAKQQWDSYVNWKKNRNPARMKLEKEFNFDCKHGSHLVRLMRTGIELMEGKPMQVWRDDAEELLAVRNGAWTYDQLEEWFSQAQDRLNELYAAEDQKLPKKPDLKLLDRLLIDITQEWYLNS